MKTSLIAITFLIAIMSEVLIINSFEAEYYKKKGTKSKSKPWWQLMGGKILSLLIIAIISITILFVLMFCCCLICYYCYGRKRKSEEVVVTLSELIGMKATPSDLQAVGVTPSQEVGRDSKPVITCRLS